MKLLQTKWCGGCKKDKSLSEFYTHRTHGYQTQCKPCMNAARHRSKFKRRDYYNRVQTEWRAAGGKEAYNTKRRDAYRALREEFIAAYGGKCVCCKERHHEFLTLEHKNHDGKQHRQQMGSSLNLFKQLKQLGWPKKDYELRCMNCNWGTRFGGICPHKRKGEGK